VSGVAVSTRTPDTGSASTPPRIRRAMALAEIPATLASPRVMTPWRGRPSVINSVSMFMRTTKVCTREGHDRKLQL
jgi:hypothetical protein